MNWIKNHIKLLLTILTFGITALVIGIVMISSYVGYKNYEKDYYVKDLEARSMVLPAPKYIEINDKFKSKYNTTLVAYAEDLTVNKDVKPIGDNKESAYLSLKDGGTVSLTVNLEETSFMDIDFVLNSTYKTGSGTKTKYGTEDLLGVVNFKINGNAMEDTVNLENDGKGQNWHHLVMGGFAIAKGQITIEISSMKNKAECMPEINKIVLTANAPLAIQKAAA